MARKQGVIEKIAPRSGKFAIVFVVLFLFTFGFLYLVGATPDGPRSDDTAANSPQDDFAIFQNEATSSARTSGAASAQLPVRITIQKIGLNDSVSNPTTTNVEELDKELLSGAVRYPTSAPLGVNGTVLLFGHSSYLPIVHNQNYKAFDGIQNLKPSDTIDIYSADTEYRYSVTGVKVADANNDVIELPQDGEHLTLVTCDSFATKSNRFVVTADLVGTYPRPR